MGIKINNKAEAINVILKNVNIVIVGHVDSGKTTTSAAISKSISIDYQVVFYQFDKIDNSPEEKRRGITINATHIPFATNKYLSGSLVDCPGHADFLKNAITGTSQSDVAIIVLSWEGVEPQTIEHIILCSRQGIRHYIIYINVNLSKAATIDPEEFDLNLGLIFSQVEDILSKNGIPSKNCVNIYGSSKLALDYPTKKEREEYYLKNPHHKGLGMEKIEEIVKAVDNFPDFRRDYDSTFAMGVDSIRHISGVGTVVAGKVLKGVISFNSPEMKKLVIVGNGKELPVVGTTIEVHKKQRILAAAGDDAGILIKGVGGTLDKSKLSTGQILTLRKSYKLSTSFECTLLVLTKSEGGRSTPFHSKFKPQISFNTTKVTCTVTLPEGKEAAFPGDLIHNVKLDLDSYQVLWNNLTFIVRESRLTIAAGMITKVYFLDDSEEDKS